MKRILGIMIAGLIMVPHALFAQSYEAANGKPFIKAVTVEGGPIASKHFQSGDENFNERHTLAIVKAETEDYGNWGLYLLTPNSVDRTSVGFGYVTDPLTLPIGPTRLELTGSLGIVTGYQDYPLPLLAAEARWVLYESGPWSFGASAAAMPYIVRNDYKGADNSLDWGVVGTTPFLSVRYQFGE